MKNDAYLLMGHNLKTGETSFGTFSESQPTSYSHVVWAVVSEASGNGDDSYGANLRQLRRSVMVFMPDLYAHIEDNKGKFSVRW